MSRLDKARGPYPVKYAVVDDKKRVVSQHEKFDDAKSSVKPGNKMVRSYGLDVTHAWDDKGDMTHNRYKDKPQAPTNFFAFK